MILEVCLYSTKAKHAFFICDFLHIISLFTSPATQSDIDCLIGEFVKTLHNVLPLLFLILGVAPATAQMTKELDTVNIQASRLELLSPGHHIQQIDSLSLAHATSQSVAELLSVESDLFIKHYGLGSLATSTLRGGSASHTALIWNGFNIQSPMNGQQDLALLPAYFVDDISIQYGGSSGLYGSGAVGGAIHLSNQPTFHQGIQAKVNLTSGSFGLLQPGLDLHLSGQRWMSRSRAFYRQADNDFRLPGLDRRQSHAQLWQHGIQQELAFLPGKRQLLQVWLWSQTSDRQLPPPLSSEISAASQQDESRRIAAQWSYTGERIRWKLRSAWMTEQLVFSDSIANIFSHNQQQTFIQEAEQQLQLGANHSVHLGLNATFQKATADGYANVSPSQQQIAAFISYLWEPVKSPWQVIGSIRQGRAGENWNPIIPSVNLRRELGNGFSLRGQAGRSFRLPTFNDLYWSPGGNPDLQPETGWNQDLGMDWAGNINTADLSGSWTIYSQAIDNWILWRPGASFWYPENVRNVWSRGLESEASLRKRWNHVALRVTAAYTLTKATVTEVAQQRDFSLGKQLIYTPLHQARTSIRVTSTNWTATYSHRITGERFTASDNSASLPGFDLGSLAASYHWTHKTFTLDLAARIDNIWAVEYQVIDNRAMPLRKGSLSVTIHFHRPFRNDPT